jgi:hypothetical protein
LSAIAKHRGTIQTRSPLKAEAPSNMSSQELAGIYLAGWLAAEKLRQGDREARFPQGSFPPHLPFAPEAPPPVLPSRPDAGRLPHSRKVSLQIADRRLPVAGRNATELLAQFP